MENDDRMRTTELGVGENENFETPKSQESNGNDKIKADNHSEPATITNFELMHEITDQNNSKPLVPVMTSLTDNAMLSDDETTPKVLFNLEVKPAKESPPDESEEVVVDEPDIVEEPATVIENKEEDEISKAKARAQLDRMKEMKSLKKKLKTKLPSGITVTRVSPVKEKPKVPSAPKTSSNQRSLTTILTKDEVSGEIRQSLVMKKPSVQILENLVVSDEKSASTTAFMERKENGTEIPSTVLYETITGSDPLEIQSENQAETTTSSNSSLEPNDLIALLEDRSYSTEKKGQEEIAKIASAQISKLKTTKRKLKKNELIESLVSDWNEDDHNEDPTDSEDDLLKELEAEISKSKPEKKTSPTKASPAVEVKRKSSAQIVTAVEAPAYKRTRIIKKKIIWDPDAPETKISYASLVSKKAIASPAKKPAPEKISSTPIPPAPRKRTTTESSSPSPSGGKKKKISEIDKLLGDEGAINMLNSLDSNTVDNDKRKRVIKQPPRLLNKVPTPSPAVEKTKSVVSITVVKPVVAKKVTSTPVMPKKRSVKSKDDTWDYIYSNQAANDDSMIIRRRSNSSYSSSTSNRRFSLDTSLPSVQNSSIEEGKFEFAKPDEKNPKRPGRPPGHSKTQPASTDSKILLKYHENYCEFQLIESETKPSSKSNCLLTSTRMKDIAVLLESLEKDDLCRCVLIASSKGGFCNGLDLEPIKTELNTEKRKRLAKDLAENLKKFLTALIKFSKPIIAGVQGSCKNIGIPILLVSDFVVADSISTFTTDYAKAGILPEGLSIANRSRKIRPSLVNQLYMLCETISSSSAYEHGLITQMVNSNLFEANLRNHCAIIGSNSTKVIQAIKQNRVKNDIQPLERALADEQQSLILNWINLNENQKKSKN